MKDSKSSVAVSLPVNPLAVVEKSEAGALSSWLGMLRRCLNPLDSNFQNYGGRGITVCGEWLDYRAFIRDMGPRPDGCSLERSNVNGAYEPSNCRWATAKEQGRNTRRNRRVLVGGVEMLATDAAKTLGVSDATVSRRRHGVEAPKATWAKVTDSQRLEIAALIAADQLTRIAIGRLYGVTGQRISQLAQDWDQE